MFAAALDARLTKAEALLGLTSFARLADKILVDCHLGADVTDHPVFADYS
jgi:hypothetical protein